jgi:hypothetical protein
VLDLGGGEREAVSFVADDVGGVDGLGHMGWLFVARGAP